MFNRVSLRKDISGGFLAAIVGLPMGLAFGVQSGLGPQAGVFTAIILAFVSSLVGGTRTLISDPTGPMTVVAATIVSLAVASSGNLNDAMPFIIGTFVLAGAFELVFGVLDLGKFVKFMPYPVVSSFMTGIGVIIIAMQLFPFLGHTSPKGFINIISNIDSPIINMNIEAVSVGAFTLILIFGLPKISSKIPSILVALLLGTLLSVMLKLNIPTIGNIPKEFPQLKLGSLLLLNWNDIQKMIIPAIMIGSLGVIDSLLTSVVADNLTNTKHNSKRTIIGQGIGNILTGLLGGIPGAGATVGTVTNIKAGGTTSLSGIVKAMILVFILFGVAQYIEMIPMAVLASILIYTGISIIDFKGIKMLFKIPKHDTLVWSVVLLFTVFNNLLNAVAAGFILACILFIGQIVKSMKMTNALNQKNVLEATNILPNSLKKDVFVQRLNGPMFFGFAETYKEISEKISKKKIIIIRMCDVPFLDQTGLITLESVIKNWHTKGKEVYMSEANAQVESVLLNNNIIPHLISNKHYFSSIEKCIAAVDRQYMSFSERSRVLISNQNALEFA